MLQTILGSGGGIGLPLARELRNYTDSIRLVGRNPEKVNDTDEIVRADVKDLSQVERVISGSEVVYVTVGFEYNLGIWQTIWPAFIQSVISACSKHGSRLVFFDNMYVYSENSLPFMTEESRIDPPSKKGKVRQQVHEMIMQAAAAKKITALIARAADFYGPETRNSILKIMVADNLMNGKKAQVFGDPDKIHTFTYTPDAAKATAILGNTPDAFNQVWHMPTTREKLTTRQWVDLVANELGREPKIQKVPEILINFMGLFIPIMREFPEMLYQSRQDYIFDSGKFEKRFGIAATRPEEGVRIMVDYIKTSLGRT